MFFRRSFFFERTRPGASMRPPLDPFTSLLVPGYVQGAIIPLVFMSVCLCVCVTFVGFNDHESWTWLISTNPGSMKAGEYGLTRATCFVAWGLELVAVAGLLWSSWWVLCETDFFGGGDAHRMLPV